MSSQDFEKISSNADLLILIYKLLDFNDQLNLSCVNAQLYNVFVNFIVKDPYKTLKVVRRASHVLVLSGTHDTVAYLQPDAFKCFLNYYAESVQVLSVRRSAMKADDDSAVVPFSMLIDEEPFPNLNSLTFENTEIQQENLELIAQHCANLQDLTLVECVQPGWIDPCCLYGNMLMVGGNVSINALKAIRSLKALTIENTSSTPPTMKYRHFWELIHEIDLKYLNLKVMVQPDNEFYRHSNPPRLKELVITTCFEKSFWSVMFPPFLANFENLSMLTLTLTDMVTGATLDLIADTCQKLEVLNFQYIKFGRVVSFSTPRKLKELSLFNCSGLRPNHLNEILTIIKLTKFTSRITRYRRDFEDFSNSALIEIFLADSTYKPTNSIYIGNTTLRELIWQEGDSCYYEDDYGPDVPWKTVPNLRKFVVSGGFIPVESLLHLKYLDHLYVTIQDITSLVEWSYIDAILKHPSLIELTVDTMPPKGKCYLGSSVSPVKGFITNVKILTIPFEIFAAGLSYWLDLLSLNRQLSLVCSFFCKRRTEFLETVIWHAKLPKDISTMEVFGFTIRVQTFRDNFQDASEKLLHKCRQLDPDIKYIDELIIRKKR